MLRRFTWLLVFFSGVALADPADMTGKVVGSDGNPIVGATVMVYGAAPKKGPATMGEYDYPDCKKKVTSGADGAFWIGSVDSSLNFRVLVLAEGFRPLMLKKVNPGGGEITARMAAAPATFDTPPLRGHVVDTNGDAVAGARVEPFGYKDGQQRGWGGQDRYCESGTYTDAKGDFVLLTKKADIQLDIRIFGREHAARNFPLLGPIDEPHQLGIGPGAIITGRLVKDDKPLAGIEVRLAQKDRGMENYIGDVSAFTDTDGKFSFKHLPVNQQLHFLATMKTLAGQGAIRLTPCMSGGDDATSDIGDISVQPGFKVAGVVVTSDKKPLPEDAKISIARWDASDSVEVPVAADGKFEFVGVPAEDAIEIYTRMSNYYISAQNESFEGLNAAFLLGMVNEDITDLCVQVDPTRPERTQNSDQQGLKRRRLTGIVKDQ